MAAGERLILVTDGITERRTDTGGRFGLDGIRGTVEGLESWLRLRPWQSCRP